MNSVKCTFDVVDAMGSSISTLWRPFVPPLEFFSFPIVPSSFITQREIKYDTSVSTRGEEKSSYCCYF